MTHEQITEEILETIAKYSEAPRAELLEAETLEELVDSMARIEIVFELEDKYGVEISDEEVLEIVSVNDIINCVSRRLDAAA